ncbi:cupin domain-containing protein [Streptomyces hainanensis]|uniref:Cupin domain-containing protein n=1 Tax=Streptomyces hainanensis TaxID=402648 RepID=A0A4R4SIM1_9ACTN|nr:cupin domain-containing protein [Streptomyces hainanensis]TDC63388.1 cupin domain-containing protein [Streptomyces hainanensis]
MTEPRPPAPAHVSLFRFDRAERAVGRFGSVGVVATRIAASPRGAVELTWLTIRPGGTIGAHAAPATQLFLVVSGEGWVAGADGDRVAISAGWGVRWEAGEVHASGTDTGLVALAAEGPGVEAYEPERLS